MRSQAPRATDRYDAFVLLTRLESLPPPSRGRLASRRGKKKAIVAVGRSILVIVWHLLSDPEARFQDLGSTWYDTRIDPERKRRTHIHQLEALGFKVTLVPAA